MPRSEMCTSWWPNRDNQECTADSVEDRGGESLCQEHVNVENARTALGLGPLIS